MGANIGTTITGQLIALDVGQLAPLFAFAGVALIVFVKKQKVHHYGLIVAGLGILFIGMEMMSGAMMPLRESEAFDFFYDEVFQSGTGNSGRYDIYSNYSVVLCICRYSAGACSQRTDWTAKCGICVVWTEHWYLYHSDSGCYWYKQECKTYHSHSFAV